MSPSAAARTMRVIAILSILSAVIFAFAGVRDVTGINDIFFSIASSGTEGVAGLVTPESRLAMAIAGGVFAGLSAMYLFISAPGIEQGNELIRRGTIYVYLTWFIVDSIASVASGNPSNLIPNLVFLTLYLGPVLLVQRDRATAATS